MLSINIEFNFVLKQIVLDVLNYVFTDDYKHNRNKTLLNPLPPELIARHAGVDRLPAHRDFKFCSLPKLRKRTYMSIWAAKG